MINSAQIAEFEKHGVVYVPDLFSKWVEVLRNGVERNMREPGQYAAENLQAHENGRFFDDYCNWQRLWEFTDFVKNSPVGEAAALLMGSKCVQIFHDHVLVKEPGTAKPTPWHQDSPYYFVDGEQTISFWIPLDVVDKASLRSIAGSHKWQKPVLPQRWLKSDNFYEDNSEFQRVPDPDKEPDKYNVFEWPMKPGDAVAFHFKTVHGARGNLEASRRRAFSLRLVGDDATYIDRKGKTSPPFPGHGMSEGQRLREDWFPQIWPRDHDR